MLGSLVESLKKAAAFNRGTQSAPVVVLWTDADRQWEGVLPALRAAGMSIFSLGDYSADAARGPAIWLKCVLANRVPEYPVGDGAVPVLYLPGVSRSDLRAIESCPRHLQPLAELQYRGVFWSQLNAKDWTVNAFLTSKNGGLGLDVAQDQSTQKALLRALQSGLLLEQKLDALRGRHLDGVWFDALLAPNPDRDLLAWLNDPAVQRSSWDDARWSIFVERCRKDYGFHPEKDGELTGAEKLASRLGSWRETWNLYSELHSRYPKIRKLLERLAAPGGLFDDVSSYPAANGQKEDQLRQALLQIGQLAPKAGRDAVIAAEQAHGERREWLWSRMGLAPLANSLESLARIASMTDQLPSGNSLDAFSASYRDQFWLVDAAAITALASVTTKADSAAVETALKSVYVPWLEECATRFQDIVRNTGGLAVEKQHTFPSTSADGICLIFVDGLRFDVAQRLVWLLEARQMEPILTTNWTSIPSVTASGKAWVSPVASLIQGNPDDVDFQPSVAGDGKPLSTYNFRKLLTDASWQVLPQNDVGDPAGRAWTECGDLDHYGHEHGLRLAREIDAQLRTIIERLDELIQAGWSHLRIVTDHGWLLVPGGMPKATLQKFEAETRWGRCAVLKGTSASSALTFPWAWCDDVRVAFPPGISSFIAGAEYAHGGLSIQEMLIPTIDIKSNSFASSKPIVEIKQITWRGLRCQVEIVGATKGLVCDIRTKAADQATSIAASPKALDDGHASLAVPDDGFEGCVAVLVVLDEAGSVVQKATTTVGE